MASRASLNKVLLIGNLTRDPELRYTPSGAAVCSFGIATNRYYVASDGEKKEETEFIKIVSWNKLAELCSQLLSKGRKVYVEGRLQTRSWETPDGVAKQTTEVVIDDMRILDSRKEAYGEEYVESSAGAQAAVSEGVDTDVASSTKPKTAEQETKPADKTVKAKEEAQIKDEDVDLDELPF